MSSSLARRMNDRTIFGSHLGEYTGRGVIVRRFRGGPSARKPPAIYIYEVYPQSWSKLQRPSLLAQLSQSRLLSGGIV
jgi:hypothetical protein